MYAKWGALRRLIRERGDDETQAAFDEIEDGIIDFVFGQVGKMDNQSQYEIEWIGQAHPELEGKIRESVTGIPQNLIFSTVLLTDDYDGPSIFLSGEEGKVRAEYCPLTKWIPIQLEDHA